MGSGATSSKHARDEAHAAALAQARHHYVTDPADKPPTYKALSKLAGVAPHVIGQQARAENWRALRAEHRATEAEIRAAERELGINPQSSTDASTSGEKSPHDNASTRMKRRTQRGVGDNSPAACTSRYTVPTGTPNSEAAVRQSQFDRIRRLAQAIDDSLDGYAHDPAKVDAAVRAAARLHELERQAHGIEDKPPETRAVAVLPAGMTVEEWQRKHAPAAEDEDGAAGARTRRH